MTGHEREELLQALRARFERHMHRHPGWVWSTVASRLEADTHALRSLRAMEASGGEPDVVELGSADGMGGPGQIVFCDCAAESPAGRRSLCYDGEALQSRKEPRPAGSAREMAAAMGVSLLTEAQYHALQRIGEFDTRTSSWLLTPDVLRAQGGALFGDRRYGRVFIYHNGAQSYYAVRGFRAWLALSSAEGVSRGAKVART